MKRKYIELSDGSTHLALESSNGSIYFYPVANNSEDLASSSRVGFFKQHPAEPKGSLFEHNIENYNPSARVSQMTQGRTKPSVEALELMADEIAEVTNNNCAYKK
ncbi:Uncharacterised protein [Legionella beliardensis]|uniref:Uncharacterized protein n=1 Tax=Legionella beliardensis TaxID=91822 RepID=A0A378JPH4_9GAMM|nr:hypothetical protein [Legionella beliardensis]STX55786.1 Uncharacterised protein [Legionella beliardensis]